MTSELIMVKVNLLYLFIIFHVNHTLPVGRYVYKNKIIIKIHLKRFDQWNMNVLCVITIRQFIFVHGTIITTFSFSRQMTNLRATIQHLGQVREICGKHKEQLNGNHLGCLWTQSARPAFILSMKFLSIFWSMVLNQHSHEGAREGWNALARSRTPTPTCTQM
jgi:hypothetical protein